MSLPETSAPLRVLIVEDEEDLRNLYDKALRKSGYAVETAATLREARVLLASSCFDAVICDMRLGPEHATDLLREQFDALRVCGTQVIVASAEPQYRPIAEEMGVDFYLEKPVAIPQLLVLLDRLIGRREEKRAADVD